MRDLVAVGGRAESTRVFEPVIRPRVVERLDNAMRYPIALIVAPAGYGKSVALRHFLAQRAAPHVRYNVRADGATLLGFVRGLVEALESVAPKAMASFPSAYDPGSRVEDQARNLAAWLFAHIKKFVGLVVVDDVHVARDEPAISVFLADVIERTREKTQWLIATRDALELPVASWLAYGYCDLPVDHVDLRFELGEAKRAAEASGVMIREEELHRLVEITDGWATALTFALRTSTRSADLSAIAAGTREMTYRYLAEQVFRELAPAEREFLLETCVYPSIDLEFLQTAGYDDAAAIVGSLRKRVAFMYADSPTVFRYHDLFRDFLEHELGGRGNRTLRAIREKAALHLEAAGKHADALGCYVRAGSAMHIVRVLDERAFDLIDRGNVDLVKQAVDALPERDRVEEPGVLAVRATFEVRAARFERAAAWFEKAIELEPDPVRQGWLRFRYANSVRDLDVAKTKTLLESALSAAHLPGALQTRVYGSLATASAAVGDLQAARSHIQRALALSAGLEDDATRIRCRLQLVYVLYFAGDFKRCKEDAMAAAREAEEKGLFALASSAYGTLKVLAYDCDDDVSSVAWYARLMGDAAAKAGLVESQIGALAEQANVEAERGNDGALVALEERLRQYELRTTHDASRSVVPANALRAAWSGDFSYALELVSGTAAEQTSPQRRALRWAEIALYAAGAGRRADAQNALRAAQHELNKERSWEPAASKRAIKALLTQAIAHMLLGQLESAHKLLRLVEREQQSMSARLRALLQAVRAIHVHMQTELNHQDVSAGLDLLRRHEYGGMALLLERLPFPMRAGESRFGALTKSEIEVLRALARGATSRTIGDETGRSSQTIDAHVKAIVKKLGCRGRREAVSLARHSGFVT